jgi:hypothetical protein
MNDEVNQRRKEINAYRVELGLSELDYLPHLSHVDPTPPLPNCTCMRCVFARIAQKHAEEAAQKPTVGEWYDQQTRNTAFEYNPRLVGETEPDKPFVLQWLLCSVALSPLAAVVSFLWQTSLFHGGDRAIVWVTILTALMWGAWATYMTRRKDEPLIDELKSPRLHQFTFTFGFRHTEEGDD